MNGDVFVDGCCTTFNKAGYAASTYSKASFNKHLECRWMSLSTDYSNYHQREFHALLKIIWGRFTGIWGSFLFPRE